MNEENGIIAILCRRQTPTYKKLKQSNSNFSEDRVKTVAREIRFDQLKKWKKVSQKSFITMGKHLKDNHTLLGKYLKFVTNDSSYIRNFEVATEKRDFEIPSYANFIISAYELWKEIDRKKLPKDSESLQEIIDRYGQMTMDLDTLQTFANSLNKLQCRPRKALRKELLQKCSILLQYVKQEQEKVEALYKSAVEMERQEFLK